MRFHRLVKELRPVFVFAAGVLLFPSLLARALPPISSGPHQDIYLTGNRICRQCKWRALNDYQVELTNRQGDTAVFPTDEIVGTDAHPWRRRLFLRSVHGVGLPGRIIVPQAFEDEPYLNY